MSKLPFERGDEQFSLEMQQAADIYQQLSAELFLNIVRRLKKRRTADLIREPYIWQLEKLNDMHLLTKENIKLIAKRAEIAESVLRDVIENEGYKVYESTHQQLAEDLESTVRPNRYKVQETLNSYANQAMYELDNLINSTLPISVRQVYQAIIQETVASIVSGIKSADQAFRDTIMRWSDKGFYGFTDKAGRNWRADTYARMVIKTTSYRVYRDMRERPAEEFGIDTFYYSMKSSARAMCSPLQHKIVTKGVTREEEGIKVLSLYDYDYGKPGGCLGINCGHYMTPFIVGINDKPELPEYLQGISPKQAEENAKAEARQRAFEREIRKNKERLKIASEIGDKELIQKFKLKEITLNGQYKDHLDNNKFLYRNLKRERYAKNPESYKNTYATLDKRLQKEYDEILQNLGNKAPKSYSDFKALNLPEKESLRQDNKVAAYVWSSTKEKLTDKQKQQAVEAYYNFKDHGVRFGGHAISQYIARMRRPNGRLMYNFDSILTVASLPLNYQSEYKGRKAKYYNRLLLIYENNSDEIVTFMKTNKPAKTLTEIK